MKTALILLTLSLSALPSASLCTDKKLRTNVTSSTGERLVHPDKTGMWAAVVLQASYGKPNRSNDTQVMINFIPSNDGQTVICLLQYTPDVSTLVVKIYRNGLQQTFDKFVQNQGWPWLRLDFQERVLRQ
jgi:hypothetical protein